MELNLKDCETYWAKIYMAGDINQAKNVCQEFVMDGLCVNIRETDYVYTMGRESGFCVEIINYPRFPSSSGDILLKTEKLGTLLLERLFQGSFTIMTPTKTYWFTRREGE